jgi:hypothetical protein
MDGWMDKLMDELMDESISESHGGTVEWKIERASKI